MEFIKVGKNIYKVSGLTVDEFCKKTGKPAKEYYSLTGKREPIKKVDKPKKDYKPIIKKEASK